MKDLYIYKIDNNYIDYLGQYEPKIMHNKQAHQTNDRKYIGILLYIHRCPYFAPLSSYKEEKHGTMKDKIDFIKIGTYAVININNMFPVPAPYYVKIDIKHIPDKKYQYLLFSEYRIIKQKKDKIYKNAQALYNQIVYKYDNSNLRKRCNNFKLLDSVCYKYNPNTNDKNTN